MTTSIIFILILLQIKHWYIDFVDQSEEEVKSKGIYGDGPGIGHSVKHGIGTFFAIIAVTGLPYIAFAGILMFVDFVLHYHIDWLKMNYGNRDITTPAFWNHLGLDQMLHQFVYIFIAFSIV
jgi:hypothetical protein